MSIIGVGRIDEGTRVWTIKETAIDSLAACMIVTIFLDLWRLTLKSMDFETGISTLSFLA
jgi:hypothetical protein